MTHEPALGPSREAALHLLRGAQIIGLYGWEIPAAGIPWEAIRAGCPDPARDLTDLAQSLGSDCGATAPIGRILDDVKSDTVLARVVIESLGIATGGGRVLGLPIPPERLLHPPQLPSWARDTGAAGIDGVQVATMLIAQKALANPRTNAHTALSAATFYDWQHAQRNEPLSDAALVAEALESRDLCIDVGAILRTNDGSMHGTYLAAFAAAAGITDDAYINDQADRALAHAARHHGLRPRDFIRPRWRTC